MLGHSIVSYWFFLIVILRKLEPATRPEKTLSSWEFRFCRSNVAPAQSPPTPAEHKSSSIGTMDKKRRKRK